MRLPRRAHLLAAAMLVLSASGAWASPEASRTVSNATAIVASSPMASFGPPEPRPLAPMASPAPKLRVMPVSPATVAGLRAQMQGPALPMPRRRVPAACSPDGVHCIGPLRYTHDVCRVIGATATEAGLDPHFFARLIWRESLFDAYAVSHAGALGIAQFIPSTAALRGLEDPFNPAAALQASAHYLRELQDRFGNLGLAAGAYNGGEARIAKFLRRQGGLPGETRDYVIWITGYRAETWRATPPQNLDLSLRAGEEFETACVNWARAHKPSREPAGMPWGMIYAAHADEAQAAQQAQEMRVKFPALLGDAPDEIHPKTMPGSGKRLYTARVETKTRDTAAKICTKLRHAGGGCMVMRNGG